MFKALHIQYYAINVFAYLWSLLYILSQITTIPLLESEATRVQLCMLNNTCILHDAYSKPSYMFSTLEYVRKMWQNMFIPEFAHLSKSGHPLQIRQCQWNSRGNSRGKPFLSELWLAFVAPPLQSFSNPWKEAMEILVSPAPTHLNSPGLSVTPPRAAWSPQRFQNSASHFHVIFSGSSFLTRVQAGLFCICFQSEKKQALKFWKSLAGTSEKRHISIAENTPYILWNKQVVYLFIEIYLSEYWERDRERDRDHKRCFRQRSQQRNVLNLHR